MDAKGLKESLQGPVIFINGNAQNHRGMNELQIKKISTYTRKKRFREAKMLGKKEKRTCFFRLSRLTVKPY